MFTLLAILVGSLFNIGIFFVLLHLLFKKKLSLGIKILIAFLLSVLLSYLFGKALIINIAGHGISAALLYLLLKSGLLKMGQFHKKDN